MKILLLISCLLCLLFGLYQFAESDMWLHTRTGAWICANHSLPHTQLYSFLLGPKQWLDHEWFFQWLVYGIFRLGGINSLIILKSVFMGAILAIFFLIARKLHRYGTLSALLIITATGIAQYRIVIRPEALSIIFILIFLALLKSYKGQDFIFWLLPLYILWVNIHGYFLSAVIIMGLFILARYLQAAARLPFSWNQNKLDDRALKKAIFVFLSLFPLSLVNPYFLKGLFYPFNVIASFIMPGHEAGYAFDIISELSRIPFPALISSGEFGLAAAAIMVFVYSLLLNIRKLDLFDFFVFLTLIYLTIAASRHGAMLVFATCLLALLNLKSSEDDGNFLFEYIKKKRTVYRRGFKVFSTGILILLIFHSADVIKGLVLDIKSTYMYNLKGDQKGYFLGKDETDINNPDGAICFIKDNKINGNIFNFTDQGAYLIFHLYPQCRIFIDNRTELYSGTHIKKYCEILFEHPEMLDGIRKEMKVTAVVLPCSDIVCEMFGFLYKSADWALVFFDGKSCVFLPNEPGYKKFIMANKIDLSGFDPKPDQALLKTAKKKRSYPASYIQAASFFNSIAMPENGLKCIKIAEEINPNSPEVHNIKAISLDALGQKREALCEFFKALRLAPHNPIFYKNVGSFFMRNGSFENGRKFFVMGLKIDPRNQELKKCLRNTQDIIDKAVQKPAA